MNRVAFVVDGFNLYHSVVSASCDLKLAGKGKKWLNIKELCESYLYQFGKDAVLENVYYFSALAYHLQEDDPDKIKRHMRFIRCLEHAGVYVELAQFKKKVNRYKLSRNIQLNITTHEEKETDVALAVKILELFIADQCDTLVIVSGDTDMVPAIKTAMRLFPHKKIVFAFPYKRKNKKIQNLSPDSFGISRKMYLAHQFPTVVHVKDGKIITKPAEW